MEDRIHQGMGAPNETNVMFCVCSIIEHLSWDFATSIKGSQPLYYIKEIFGISWYTHTCCICI